MEGLVLLLALLVFALPIAGIIAAAIALRRSRELREQVQTLTEEKTRQFQALWREIKDLRTKLDAASPTVGPAQQPPLRIEVPVMETPAKPAASIPEVAPPKAVAQPPKPEAPTVESKAPAPASTRPPAEPSRPLATPPPPRPVSPATPPKEAPGPSRAAVPPEIPAAPPIAARIASPSSYSPLKIPAPKPTMQQRIRKVSAIEETLGTNWLNKLGIIILVLGIALFGIYELGTLGPAGKVAVSFLVSVGLLAGGVFLEKRERYLVLGRTGIGGGWALLFFSSYAMHHVDSMRILASETADLALMLIVAVGMAVHTLRYRSQLVTGLGFLLGYTTVALSHDTVYSLSAGVILAIGLVAIVLKMSWFELEIFGILSGYLNHWYWLYRLLGPHGAEHHAFPEYRGSMAMLLFFWLTFRISYIVRKISSPMEERLSTVAALLNTLLLLGIMKFQSVQPELAYIALFAVGGLEFALAQLPITRRRREAFVVLSVVGAALILTAVPFHYANNNVAQLWLVGAEVLLIAGITAKENVFRRLGLLIGLLIGGWLLAVDFRQLLHERSSSETVVLAAGITFGLCALGFYLNFLGISVRYRELFPPKLDEALLTVHSYLGAFSAAAALWAFFANDWLAVAFALLMLMLSVACRRLPSMHLQVQCGLVATLAFYRTVIFNLHTDAPPHAHLIMRIITLPILAAAFYLTARLAPRGDDQKQQALRALLAFGGTSLLTLLFAFEVAEYWQPIAFIALAIALAETGHKLRYSLLNWHAHILSAISIGLALGTTRSIHEAWHSMTFHAFAAVPAIAGCYWLAKRVSVLHNAGTGVARNLYTWGAALVVFALIWTEANETWTAPAYLAAGILFALAGRKWKLSHLGFQENVFVATAISAALKYNFTLTGSYGHFSVRLISVAFLAAGLYAISRLSAQPGAVHARAAAYLHTFAATGLLAYLAWFEASAGWLAAVWAGFALALVVIDRRFQLDDLRWQAHALALLSMMRGVAVNLHTTESWYGVSVRLLSLTLVAASFYAISRLVRMPEQWREREFHQIYSWSASVLVSLLIWYELEPLSVAVGWAIFGLVLFEYGFLRKIRQLRWQANIAFAASFLRIFFVNLTAGVTGVLWGPRVYTVLPLALIYFFVYSQQDSGPEAVVASGRIRSRDVLAWLGSATVVAFLYFQVVTDWVAAALAAFVFVLLGVALLLRRKLFLYQGLLLTLGVVARGTAHNLFGSSYFHGRDWQGRFFVLGTAIAILFAALPVAYRLRAQFPVLPDAQGLRRKISLAASRPEQFLFFGATVLLTLMLFLKMDAGMVTVSWGIEGAFIILLGFAAKERSFRVSGLLLLLLCVAKLLTRDVWDLQPRDRYITFIIVGAAMLTVSFFYSKYRETIRQFL